MLRYTYLSAKTMAIAITPKGKPMKKNIGEVIRCLRKEQQLTQEKLAEALGVSFQSVSRWENGLAYPDITLIPSIARFFNVSTDTLFDMNNEDLQKRHTDLETAFLQFRSCGDTEGCITLMQEARREFPRDYHFMMNLAEAMESCSDGSAVQKESYKSANYGEQIHSLCQQVLEDCNVDAERYRAIRLLCNYFSMAGNTGEALHLLEGVADIRHSREIMLESILSGEDKLHCLQGNMLFAIEYTADTMAKLAFRKDYGLAEKLSIEKKILYITTAINLYKALFSDGNYLYYHRPLCWNYRRLAELYFLQNDVENAYQALSLAEHHAEKFDMLSTDSLDNSLDNFYTSPFVNTLKYVPQQHMKHWVGTERKMLLYRLKELGGYFGTHEGLKKLKERLEKATCGEDEVEVE